MGIVSVTNLKKIYGDFTAEVLRVYINQFCIE